ncbi:MAG: sporulation protein [Methylophilaceae bacterium]
MRLWLLLFVLLNIALLVYFNMDTLVPKAKIVRQEINPEKLKLLVDKDFESILRKAVVVSASTTSCYKWGKFTASNLAAAQEVVEKLGLEAELIQESSTKQDNRFWVYYPPLASAEVAVRKAEEIKKLGIDELYIVQGKQWRNAISFGLFSEEPLAVALLKELKSKGVKNAVKSLRKQGVSTGSLLVKAVASPAAVELYKIRPQFVGTEVTPSPCP